MKTGRASLRFLAAAAALSIAAVSCGGGDRDVEAWTTDVCGSMSSWIRSLQSGGESVERELEDVSPGDIRSAQESVARFLDRAVENTEGLIEEIEDAGAPDIEDGDRVIEALEDGFGRIRNAFEEAQERIEEVPPDDAEAFVRASEGVERSLNRSAERIESFFEEASSEGLGRGELDEEFERNEACSELKQLEF